MIKAYYYLTKPGIIYGNAMVAIAGFFLASKSHFDFKLFLAMLFGLSFIIASACVFNNMFDYDIDSKMDRTKNRAMVTGKISKTRAAVFATILLILGIIALHHHVNQTALLTALLGFLIYTLVYTPLKHRTVHATLVGAIAGATPPVVGYTAVTNQVDTAAILLFLILIVWQMPHFYAIAIRRLNEYKAASIPVLPAVKGIRFTKISMLIYIVLFVIATSLLYFYKYTGKIYFIVMLLLGLDWLINSIRGFKQNVDNQAWAKKIFFFSLIVLLIFSITISFSGIIHA